MQALQEERRRLQEGVDALMGPVGEKQRDLSRDVIKPTVRGTSGPTWLRDNRADRISHWLMNADPEACACSGKQQVPVLGGALAGSSLRAWRLASPLWPTKCLLPWARPPGWAQHVFSVYILSLYNINYMYVNNKFYGPSPPACRSRST